MKLCKICPARRPNVIVPCLILSTSINVLLILGYDFYTHGTHVNPVSHGLFQAHGKGLGRKP